MKVRINVILEFDGDISKEEYKNAMADIYNEMWEHATDVDVINEEEI